MKFWSTGVVLYKILIFGMIVNPMTEISMAQDWQSYTTENSELVSNNVRSVSIDSLGIKWFGTDSGLSGFDGFTWRTITADTNKKTLAHNSISDIASEWINNNSEIWVATDSGVSVIGVDIDAITMATPYYKDNTGLISNKVNTAFVDNFHIKWFGTDSGLSRFTGSEWRSFTKSDLLSANYILSMDADKTGWKYIGTKGGGVSRLFDNGVDAITSASPLEYDWSEIPSDSIFAVYVTDNGDQWFGTDNGVAFHEGSISTVGWTNYSVHDGLAHDFVQAIAEGVDGKIWIGTRGGVSCFNGSTWTTLTLEDGLVGNNVRDIAVDRDSSLWFATDQGISHFTGTTTSIGRTSLFSAAVRNFRLYPNYPNPFNPTTMISYELQFTNYVELSIYNMLGQKVVTLVSDRQPAGTHQVEWNAGGFASGVYYYRLHTSVGFVQTKKLILLK